MKSGRQLKVTVLPQAKRFYLAHDKWIAGDGHEVKVGQFRFAVIMTPTKVLVYEVTSGSEVIQVPIALPVYRRSQQPGEKKKLLKIVGENIRDLIVKTEGDRARDQINRRPSFSELVEESKKKTHTLLGEKPDTQLLKDIKKEGGGS